jgi:outer membrane immunogenic protein
MNKLFLTSAALVALGLATPAALAADMRVAPAPAPLPAYTNWSGCYVGATAGTSSGRTDGFSTTGASTAGSPTTVVVPGGTPVSQSFNLSGFIGGGTLGCNWQAGMWVFGIEGDGSATNKSGQAFPAVISLGNGVTVNEADQFEMQERWLVTARGKLGLAGWLPWFGDKTMVYITGGGAWAKIDSSLAVIGNPIPTGFSQSDTRSGWTIGGGLEYALGYGWSAKSEFLYVDFGNWNTVTCTAGAGCPVGTITNMNVNLKDYIWRAGLNYKFW